eukprot:PITA_24997
MSYYECQVFQGKRKLLLLPLNPVEVNAPFQQWGLDFIGEIHPTSLAQHRWILTATDYFTKWIEAIPTRQAMDTVIIQFLESNIFSGFGCPHKIITDKEASFKSKKMVELCNNLGHEIIRREDGSEEDDIRHRINQMIHLQQTREEVSQNIFQLQEKIKKIYDRKTKAEKFHLEDVVLRWDAQNEEKGKHGKFENLWKGPYKISAYRG